MDHVTLHHLFYTFATHHTGRVRHADAADPACSEGLPLVTPLLGDTAARDDQFRLSTLGIAHHLVARWNTQE